MKIISIIMSKVLTLGMTAMTPKAFAAESQVSTAGATTGGGVVLTDAIRTVYSKEIEYNAMPNMVFHQFATVKTELGVEPGLTISMLTFNNLKRGGKLEEMVDMTTQSLSSSTKQITVTEYGNAVSVTEKLLQSSFANIMAEATTLLGRDYATTLDCELRDAALSNTTNVVYAGGKENRWSITEDDGMTVSLIKDAIEILSTGDAPKYQGRNWVCILHPHQARVLRDDPAWINSSDYGAPQQFFNGEIGKIDDTVFIQTTLMCNGACSVDDPAYDSTLAKDGYMEGHESDHNAAAVYQAVLFGDAYYGLAVSLPVELRDNGVEDFGRKRSLAWYSIFGTGLLHEKYGVLIETA